MAEKQPKTPRKKPAVAESAAPSAAGPASLPVLGADNKSVGNVTLSPDVFAAKINTHLIYEAVKLHRAGARAGTHQTKTRGLVAGSGRKPWRQKGTGRARVGEVRNPLWRHGGTVFGPVSRDHSLSMPKKARAAALRAALSQRVREGVLKVVDAFPIEVPAQKPYRLTHQLAALLERLGVAGKATLVAHAPSAALMLSGRNHPKVRIVTDAHLTVYDVLDCKTLLVQREALARLEERLTP